MAAELRRAGRVHQGGHTPSGSVPTLPAMSLPAIALCFALGPAEPSQGTNIAPLEQAIGSASPTTESANQLASALTEAEARALDLVDDGNALELLDRARLALVSIHLALGDTSKAEAAMDEVIRSAMGRDIAAGSFGPAVLELYGKRQRFLQQSGTATIEIKCPDCEVIVNEVRASGPELHLYLGHYRVWVVFADPNRAPERLDIELREPGSVVQRSFSAKITEQPQDKLEFEGPHHKRLLPRWAELTGVSAGAVVLIGGIVLAALNDKCIGNALGGDPDTCPDLYENRPQDKVILGIGAGVMAAFGVVLTVDEVRVGRARGQQAMLTWTTQF